MSQPVREAAGRQGPSLQEARSPGEMRRQVAGAIIQEARMQVLWPCAGGRHQVQQELGQSPEESVGGMQGKVGGGRGG